MSRPGRSFDGLAAFYRLLLRAYSRRFREAWGRELEELFRARCARSLAEGGRAALLAWVCRAVFDVLCNAPGERLSGARGGAAVGWRAGAGAIPGGHAVGGGTMLRLRFDLRLALRMLARQPGLAATLVLTLALGTGATTALFSVLDAALLRPLPYPAADRLVAVRQVDPAGVPQPFAPPYLEDLRERVARVEGLAGFSPSWELTLTGLGEPRRVVGAYVSDGLLELLGARPLAGRTFDAVEHAPGGPPAVLVSLPFWLRHFGEPVAPDGRTLELDGQPYAVVGVLAALPLPLTSSAVSRDDRAAELWLPFAKNPYATLRAIPVMNVIGRLPVGGALEAALAELEAAGASIAADHPETSRWAAVTATPLHEVVTRHARGTALALFGGAVLLLLIACTNVANLLLARAMARGHELAVRRALGAGRRHLFGQLLAEGLVVASLGCAGGLLLAGWLVTGLPVGRLAGLPPAADVRLDLRMAAFAALLAGVTALVFGLLPAARATGGVAAILRTGARSTGGGSGLRSALVSAQVALAVALLFGAGLLGRSLWNLARVDPGFTAEGLLAVPVPLAGERYGDADSRRAFVDRLLGELAVLPGASRVAAVNRLPLGGGNVFVGVEAEDAPLADELAPTVDRRVATPGYFGIMGVSMVEGREFGPEDDPASAVPAAIVNEEFARRFWQGSPAVGRRLRLMLRSGPGPWLTVVGVAGDVRHHGLDRPPEPEIYVPYAQASVEGMTFLLRTSGDAAALLAPAKEAVWRLDPNLPLDGAGPVEAVVRGSVDEPRLRAFVLNAFAALALLLAAVGIHGVVAYSVTQRTRETGVRIALGAGTGDVLRGVVGQGIVHAGRGVLIGLALAWLAGRALSGLLFGVEPADAVTFAGTGGLLLLVAAAASYLPARRAARTDPARVLSGE